MGIDTFVVVPAIDPAKVRRALDPEESDTTTVGADFVVVYLMDRFSNVEEEPERYGVELARALSPALRKRLDPRGIAAYPEVGQAFPEPSYEALLAAHGAPLWLPTLPAPRVRRTKRVLLVALSAARERALMADPALVKELPAAHAASPIPGSLEVDAWIEVQRTLFDAMTLDGGSDRDPRADAVTPRGGLPLYEDRTVDAARLVRAADVARTAAWLAALPADVVTRVRAMPARSASAACYPAILGAAPADDDEPLRAGRKRVAERRPPADAVRASIERLIAFYAGAAREAKAVLSMRYRA